MTVVEYAVKAATRLNGVYQTVEKANGVIKHGIMMDVEGSNAKPTIYVDDAYEKGIPIDTFVEKVKEQIANITPFDADHDINAICDYETARPMLRARLYNKKTKADVFTSAAPYGFDDLIIIPYIQFTDEAAAKVTKHLLNDWGKSEGYVIADALANTTDYQLKPMTEVLRELMGEMPLPFDDDIPLYVLSSTNRTCGAIMAITQRKLLEASFPEGYKVIPSSIHEVIIVPNGGSDAGMDDLAIMISEVNASEVLPEEVLGDHAYEF